MDALRFIICGSADDGKSTLIGCLLQHGAGPAFESGMHVQGAAIDGAERYFFASKRKFFVAEMPKSERLLSVAATADLAVLLVDARKGLQTQTKRHSRIVSMLGVRHVVLAVNMMDIIGWDEVAFNAIVADFQALVADAGFASVQAIPMSTLTGDNVTVRKTPSLRRGEGSESPTQSLRGGAADAAIQNDKTLDRHGLRPRDDNAPSLRASQGRGNPADQTSGEADKHRRYDEQGDEAIQNGNPMDRHALAYPEFTEGLPMTGDWYAGPTLLEYLGTVDISKAQDSRPFRMPVQYVDRTNPESRGYCGNIASGSMAVGSPVRIVPGGAEAQVKSIVERQGGQEVAGDAVCITLDREVDVERGQVFSSVDDPIQISDQFQASVLCLSEHHLVPGRPYLIKLHAAQVGVTITDIKFKLDIDQGSHLAANTLELNDIGDVTLYTSHPVAFEAYKQCKSLGAFILIDRMTNETVGAGVINFALRRASNIHWQAVDVNKAARAALKSQKPACLWFTGLSGSGKSTIANLLEKRLHAEGRHTYLLDGDNVRHGLNRDLGFTEADRVENIRRVAEVTKLMVDAGLIVIVSFISPFRAEREYARSLFPVGEFYEVFVDTPIEECERRDVKGLYVKARQGKLLNFTGIDSPYERPLAPEVSLDTMERRPNEIVDELVTLIS